MLKISLNCFCRRQKGYHRLEILDLNDSWAGHGLLLSPLAVVVYVNLVYLLKKQRFMLRVFK
ncbi:hypothetical protein ZEAMMB73_Zm00001d033426 [Zea mays]|uniref:Uncharacterized protein n=1 Tax=Zea mays TaxID=4577 RepID=A0A1D6KYY2_MAIZE|nr:hypothetical protein ZEAMMB73_Zm00001d033426 [Zea mays]